MCAREGCGRSGRCDEIGGEEDGNDSTETDETHDLIAAGFHKQKIGHEFGTSLNGQEQNTLRN